MNLAIALCAFLYLPHCTAIGNSTCLAKGHAYHITSYTFPRLLVIPAIGVSAPRRSHIYAVHGQPFISVGMGKPTTCYKTRASLPCCCAACYRRRILGHATRGLPLAHYEGPPQTECQKTLRCSAPLPFTDADFRPSDRCSLCIARPALGGKPCVSPLPSDRRLLASVSPRGFPSRRPVPCLPSVDDQTIDNPERFK